MTTELFDSIAAVLRYPTEEYPHRVAECMKRIEEGASTWGDGNDQAVTHLVAFIDAVRGLSLADLEELYTRTFDINPVSSLEVGWHLHGETYERGAFLVTMRDMLRRCAIEESTELPDHLTHVLLAVGRMSDEEAEVFISRRLIKALDKMLEGFAEKDNPYEHILQATRILLSHHVHEGAQR